MRLLAINVDLLGGLCDPAGFCFFNDKALIISILCQFNFRRIPKSIPNSLYQFDVVSERLHSNIVNYPIQIKTNCTFYFDFFDAIK